MDLLALLGLLGLLEPMDLWGLLAQQDPQALEIPALPDHRVILGT